MKLFGFEIKKFEQQPTTIEAVETWVVKWHRVYRYTSNFFGETPVFVTFTTESSANAYAEELRDARKLLGDTDLNVIVYKQEVPTNV